MHAVRPHVQAAVTDALQDAALQSRNKKVKGLAEPTVKQVRFACQPVLTTSLLSNVSMSWK